MKLLFLPCNKVAKSKHPFILMATAALFALTTQAQDQQTLDTVQQMDEVLVQSVRATAQTPVTFSNVTKAELAPRNLGQDIPVLLNYLPSVVTKIGRAHV